MCIHLRARVLLFVYARVHVYLNLVCVCAYVRGKQWRSIEKEDEHPLGLKFSVVSHIVSPLEQKGSVEWLTAVILSCI